MKILLPNPSQVVLQVYALDPDGSEKTDIVTATVRVYHIAAGSEVDDLPETAMAQVGTTNKWRYVWSSPTLPAGEYTAEYTLTDSVPLTTKFGEEISVKDIAEQTTLTLVQADASIIRKVETGRWHLVGDQMIFYDETDTVILTFDLKDQAGLPTMTDVFQRVPSP